MAELQLQIGQPHQQGALALGRTPGGRDLAPQDDGHALEVAGLGVQGLQRVQRGQVVGLDAQRVLQQLLAPARGLGRGQIQAHWRRAVGATQAAPHQLGGVIQALGALAGAAGVAVVAGLDQDLDGARQIAVALGQLGQALPGVGARLGRLIGAIEDGLVALQGVALVAGAVGGLRHQAQELGRRGLARHWIDRRARQQRGGAALDGVPLAMRRGLQGGLAEQQPRRAPARAWIIGARGQRVDGGTLVTGARLQQPARGPQRQVARALGVARDAHRLGQPAQQRARLGALATLVTQPRQEVQRRPTARIACQRTLGHRARLVDPIRQRPQHIERALEHERRVGPLGQRGQVQPRRARQIAGGQRRLGLVEAARAGDALLQLLLQLAAPVGPGHGLATTHQLDGVRADLGPRHPRPAHIGDAPARRGQQVKQRRAQRHHARLGDADQHRGGAQRLGIRRRHRAQPLQERARDQRPRQLGAAAPLGQLDQHVIEHHQDPVVAVGLQAAAQDHAHRRPSGVGPLRRARVAIGRAHGDAAGLEADAHLGEAAPLQRGGGAGQRQPALHRGLAQLDMGLAHPPATALPALRRPVGVGVGASGRDLDLQAVRQQGPDLGARRQPQHQGALAAPHEGNLQPVCGHLGHAGPGRGYHGCAAPGPRPRWQHMWAWRWSAGLARSGA